MQAESRGTSPDQPYAWTGREYDPETGFYFLRARYYDPTLGRFTQEDPIGEAGGSNLYAYVEGQPLEARDPSGLLSTGDAHRFPEFGCDADMCGGGYNLLDMMTMADASPFGSLIDYVWAGQMDCGSSPMRCQEQRKRQELIYVTITELQENGDRTNRTMAVPLAMVATVLAEADGGAWGMHAVASTIMNAVGQTNDYDATMAELNPGRWAVVRYPDNKHVYGAAMSFGRALIAGGSPTAPDRLFLAQAFGMAAEVAAGHYTGYYGDTSNGATHMFQARTPHWARTYTRVYPTNYSGRNWFFRP